MKKLREIRLRLTVPNVVNVTLEGIASDFDKKGMNSRVKWRTQKRLFPKGPNWCHTEEYYENMDRTTKLSKMYKYLVEYVEFCFKGKRDYSICIDSGQSVHQ